MNVCAYAVEKFIRSAYLNVPVTQIDMIEFRHSEYQNERKTTYRCALSHRFSHRHFTP